MFVHAFAAFISIKFLPLLYALIGFGALIAIHEFGHFLFCKLFGIHTPTFSIGFGPELFRRKIGTTNFRLALIPLGGYVEIAGLEEVGQGEQKSAKTEGDLSFSAKPYWQKFLVLSGGVIFNLLFAYIVFCGLLMIGSPKPHAITVTNIIKESAAAKGGLLPGDGIIQINNKKLINVEDELIENSFQTLLQEIQANPNKGVNLTIRRKNEIKELEVVLGSKDVDGETIGSLGTELRPPLTKLPFLKAIKQGITTTNRWIYNIIQGIKHLITRRTLEGAGGPVMILAYSFTSAQHGFVSLLTFLALISINLALINVLPIGALDGGKLLFVTIEAIIRRKIPDLVRNIIDGGSLLLFISLFVFLTYKDIVVLFGPKLSALWDSLMSLLG